MNRTRNILQRDLLAAATGPLLTQGVTIALVPVLFRLYSPAEFGLWASVQALAVIGGSMATFRYDLAIVIERDQNHASQLFFAVACLVTAYSSLLALFLVIWTAIPGGIEIDSRLAMLAWIWLSSIAACVVLHSWMMRGGAFSAVSLSLVLNASTTNAIQIVAGMLGGDGIWLVVGSVCGQLASIAFCVLNVARNTCRPCFRTVNVERLWTRLNDHKRFLQYSLPFTILSLIRERAPILIITGLSTTQLVGVYSQAWRLAHVPSGFTSAALRPVFFHRAAAHGLQSQAQVVNRIIICLLLASSPWIGIAIFGHATLSILLLGPRWLAAGEFIAIIIVPATLFMITNWLDRLLDVAERQDLNFKTELIAGPCSAAILGGALFVGTSITVAVGLQCIVLTVTYIWFLWSCYGVAKWPRKALAIALMTAVTSTACVYVVLTVLGIYLSDTIVVIFGICGIAIPATVAAVISAFKGLG